MYNGIHTYICISMCISKNKHQVIYYEGRGIGDVRKQGMEWWRALLCTFFNNHV